MIMQYLKNLLSKHEKPNQKEVVPVFHITETLTPKSDFEVTELSYEEYVRFTNQERRHASRAVVYDRRNLSGARSHNHQMHA